MKLQALRTTLVALAVAGLAACGSDNNTGPNGQVNATYKLTAVNGETVPATFETTTHDTITFNSGTLTLKSDGTFTSTVNVTQRSNSTPVTADVPLNGTYTVNGSNYTFTDASDGSQLTGSVNGTTLTFNDTAEGVVLTLVKQ